MSNHLLRTLRDTHGDVNVTALWRALENSIRGNAPLVPFYPTLLRRLGSLDYVTDDNVAETLRIAREVLVFLYERYSVTGMLTKESELMRRQFAVQHYTAKRYIAELIRQMYLAEVQDKAETKIETAIRKKNLDIGRIEPLLHDPYTSSFRKIFLWCDLQFTRFVWAIDIARKRFFEKWLPAITTRIQHTLSYGVRRGLDIMTFGKGGFVRRYIQHGIRRHDVIATPTSEFQKLQLKRRLLEMRRLLLNDNTALDEVTQAQRAILQRKSEKIVAAKRAVLDENHNQYNYNSRLAFLIGLDNVKLRGGAWWDQAKYIVKGLFVGTLKLLPKISRLIPFVLRLIFIDSIKFIPKILQMPGIVVLTLGTSLIVSKVLNIAVKPIQWVLTPVVALGRKIVKGIHHLFGGHDKDAPDEKALKKIFAIFHQSNLQTIYSRVTYLRKAQYNAWRQWRDTTPREEQAAMLARFGITAPDLPHFNELSRRKQNAWIKRNIKRQFIRFDNNDPSFLDALQVTARGLDGRLTARGLWDPLRQRLLRDFGTIPTFNEALNQIDDQLENMFCTKVKKLNDNWSDQDQHQHHDFQALYQLIADEFERNQKRLSIVYRKDIKRTINHYLENGITDHRIVDQKATVNGKKVIVGTRLEKRPLSYAKMKLREEKSTIDRLATFFAMVISIGFAISGVSSALSLLLGRKKPMLNEFPEMAEKDPVAFSLGSATGASSGISNFFFFNEDTKIAFRKFFLKKFRMFEDFDDTGMSRHQRRLRKLLDVIMKVLAVAAGAVLAVFLFVLSIFSAPIAALISAGALFCRTAVLQVAFSALVRTKDSITQWIKATYGREEGESTRKYIAVLVLKILFSLLALALAVGAAVAAFLIRNGTIQSLGFVKSLGMLWKKIISALIIVSVSIPLFLFMAPRYFGWLVVGLFSTAKKLWGKDNPEAFSENHGVIARRTWLVASIFIFAPIIVTAIILNAIVNAIYVTQSTSKTDLPNFAIRLFALISGLSSFGNCLRGAARKFKQFFQSNKSSDEIAEEIREEERQKQVEPEGSPVDPNNLLSKTRHVGFFKQRTNEVGQRSLVDAMNPTRVQRGLLFSEASERAKETFQEENAVLDRALSR